VSYRIVGAPATGESFFDREELIERVFNRLKSGSILLVAPRRFGKTSIMLKVREKLAADNKLALYLDVEWVSEPSDFITEILYKLRENANRSFSTLVKNLPKGLLNSVKRNVDTLEIAGFRLKLREELKDAWMEKGREIFKTFKTLNVEIVLFVDEFPLMLYNMHFRRKLDPAAIHNFLYWLRSMRMETNIRMVLGGSIGIDHILKSLDAGASINDLERIFVGPFNREDTSKFVLLLFESEGIKIDSKTVEKILEVLEVPIPYFIQIMVSTLLNEVRSLKTSISPEMVEDVYRKRVLGVECRSYFDHYFQRLSMYYSPQDADVAKKLLKELALRNKMSKKDLFKSYSVYAQSDDVERFNYIVGELENDFYLQFDEKKGEYSFATKVLKDLWLRRYEVLE
jgi:hypothetical protein